MLHVFPKLFSHYSANFIKGMGILFHLSICSSSLRYRSGIMFSGLSFIFLSNATLSIICCRSMSPFVVTAEGWLLEDYFYCRDAPLLPRDTRDVDRWSLIPSWFPPIWELISSSMSSRFGWMRSSSGFCFKSNFWIFFWWLRVANSDFASDAANFVGVLSFLPSALFIFLWSLSSSVVDGLNSYWSTSEGSTT